MKICDRRKQFFYLFVAIFFLASTHSSYAQRNPPFQISSGPYIPPEKLMEMIEAQPKSPPPAPVYPKYVPSPGQGIYMSVENYNDKGVMDSSDPVAKKLGACLDENSDTQGMNGCYSDSLAEYEQILDDVYQQIEAVHPKDPEDAKFNVVREAVKRSQLAWLASRKAQGEAMEIADRTNYPGTIEGLLIGIQEVNSIRESIAELEFFLGAGQG